MSTSKLAVLATAAAFLLVQRIFSSSDVSWKVVQEWLRVNANPDNYGRGYAGSGLLRPKNAYADIRLERLNSSRVRVIAQVFFDPRQGAAVSQTWEGTGVDRALTKRFGDGMRFRVNV